MARGVRIGILLPPSLEAKASGRKFFQHLKAHLAPWMPERYDISEPVRRAFSVDNLDETLEHWMSGFLFRRRRPRVTGHIVLGSRFRGMHDVVLIDAPAGALPSVGVSSFILALHREWGVDLAYIHVETDADLEDLEYYDRCLARFQALGTRQLRQGLPCLSWAVYFGAPYIELLGKERLRTAPAAEITELDESLICLQLTSDVRDPARDPKGLRQEVDRVIEHLGTQAFVMPGANKAEKVPSFGWLTGQGSEPA